MNKNILAFLAGLVVGVAGTYIYVSKKHEDDFIDEVDSDATVIEEKSELEQVIEEEKKVLVMNKNRYEKIANRYNEIAKPIYLEPYVISFEEFCEDSTGHDQITITYYEKNDMLVGEDDEVIENVGDVIGLDALYKFGTGSEDPDVVYVRNSKLRIDYEIVRDHGSFLGEGCD